MAARLIKWRGTTGLPRTGEVLGTGMLAAWGLNEPGSLLAFDASGNNYMGTLTNTPLRVPGPFQEQALAFDGSSNYVLTTLTNINFAAGAVTWWQKPTAAFNAGTIRAPWGQTATGELSSQVFIDNNFYVGWNVLGTDSRVTFAASAATYPTAIWSAYQFFWSGAGSVLTMNGRVIGTNATAPVTGNLASAFTIGRQGALSGAYFPGALADIRIYVRAVTPSVAPTATVDWWKPFALNRRIIPKGPAATNRFFFLKPTFP